MLGVTPLARTFPAGDDAVTFVVRKAGFAERTVQANLARDGSFSVALKALPVARSRPATQPAPGATPAPAPAPAKKPDDGMGRVGDLKKMGY